MGTIVSLFLGIGGIAKTIFGWIMKLPWYDIALLAMALVCLVEYGLLHEERTHVRKLDARLHSCLIVQQQLAEKSHQQQKITTKTIDHYITVDRPVIKKEVQRIETAPIIVPGATPKEVLDADI